MLREGSSNFWTQYDSTTNVWNSSYQMIWFYISNPASLSMAIQSNTQIIRSYKNQCFRTTHRTWNKPISGIYQPKNCSTKRQPIQSRCKTTCNDESSKWRTCQYSNHYQLFHIVKTVQEIKLNWRILQRKEILRRPDQCIELTPRDFHICATNHSLTNNERSQLVVSCLKGGALEF